MGTNFAPLVADLFLYFYVTYFMLSLSKNTQQDVIFALNNNSRYRDDIFNLDNSYFYQIVSNIYPTELQLNKTNSLNLTTSLLDLHKTIKNNSIHAKIYDKRADFDFGVVNYPYLDGDLMGFIYLS
jgi:hypothetical protein